MQSGIISIALVCYYCNTGDVTVMLALCCGNEILMISPD